MLISDQLSLAPQSGMHDKSRPDYKTRPYTERGPVALSKQPGQGALTTLAIICAGGHSIDFTDVR